MDLGIKDKLIGLELYQKIMDTLPYGIMVCDPVGEFLLWNEQATILLNSARIENVGIEHYVEKFGVFKLDKETKFLNDELPIVKALNGESSSVKMFVRNHNIPEGKFLHVQGYPIRDGYDNIIVAIITFEDITKQEVAYEKVISKLDELGEFLKETMNKDVNDAFDAIKDSITFSEYKSK